jgi:outer membrane PBP1 activator LpoA protein
MTSRRSVLTQGAALLGATSTSLLVSQNALAQSGKIRVGLMLPYTGTFAQLGVAIENGVRMAINEQGGKLGGRDLRIYMSCGQFESLIYYNRSLQPLLQGANLDVRYTEAPDGHNWICWRDRLREGLTWLVPGYLWMVYD